MNEIEKLYENVGITKIGNKKCTPTEFLDCQNYCFISENNKCDKFSFEYPPFTAEKQLELIKWLIIEGYIEDMLTVQISEENFEACLADTFNELWQSLTEEEKQQVKGILE